MRLDEDLVERDNMEDNLTRLGSEEMVEREERKLEKLLPASATLHNCLPLMDIPGCRHSGFGRSGFGVRGLDVRGLDVRGSD